MTHKPLILAATLVVGTLVFSAPSASAVVVENPGMHAVTGENTLSIHGYLPGSMSPNLVEFTTLKCNNTWEATTTGTGEIDIHSVDFDAHTGSIGPCATVDDCDDAGWLAEIEEGHLGTAWEYAVHATFCLDVDGMPLSIECQLAANGASVHCGGVHDNEGPDTAEAESHVFVREVAPGVPVEFAIEGELFIDPPIQLMHE